MRNALAALIALGCGCQKADLPTEVAVAPGASMPAPARPPVVATPEVAGPIGTAGPVSLVATDPEGGWVVACQARRDTDGRPGIEVQVGHHGDLHGDAMVPYVIRGDGAGEEVTAFVASSPDGRWLAVLDGAALVLVDARSNQRWPLPDADVRRDPDGNAHRVAVFDAASARMVYLRRKGDHSRVVIRELIAGTEREIEVPGDVWRVEPDAAGPWAAISTVRQDTDRDGKLAWPRVETSAATADCRGPMMSWTGGGRYGDWPDLLWLRLDRGEVVPPAAALRPIGDAALALTPGGGLRRGAEVWIPDGCAPQVLAVSADPPRAIASCGDQAPTDEARLELFGPSLRVALGVRAPRGVRLGPIPLLAGSVLCGLGDECFDLWTGAPLPGRVVAHDGGVALLATAAGWSTLEVATRRTQRLDVPGGAGFAQTNASVAIGTTIVDLRRQASLGTVSARPLAVDRGGHALVAASGDPDVQLVMGPLHWEAPRP